MIRALNRGYYIALAYKYRRDHATRDLHTRGNYAVRQARNSFKFNLLLHSNAHDRSRLPQDLKTAPMWLPKLLITLQAAATLVAAQLTLPKPPFLPPNISAGASPSSGGSPNPKWSSLLGTLLYFYDEQRSGTLPSTNRVPWRNDSLILEGRNIGIDLSGMYGSFSADRLSNAVLFISGGFYDAGGQFKIFLRPNSEVLTCSLDYSKDTFPLVCTTRGLCV